MAATQTKIYWNTAFMVVSPALLNAIAFYSDINGEKVYKAIVNRILLLMGGVQCFQPQGICYLKITAELINGADISVGSTSIKYDTAAPKNGTSYLVTLVDIARPNMTNMLAEMKLLKLKPVPLNKQLKRKNSMELYLTDSLAKKFPISNDSDNEI